MSPSPDPATAGPPPPGGTSADPSSTGGTSPGPSSAGRPSGGGLPAASPGAGEPPDELFTALADGTRRRILRAVADEGPVTATALAEAMPVSRQAVAKHLALLRTAGLVVAERSGRETQFTAVSEPLDDLARWAEVAGRRWDDRLDRLRRRFG